MQDQSSPTGAAAGWGSVRNAQHYFEHQKSRCGLPLPPGTTLQPTADPERACGRCTRYVTGQKAVLRRVVSEYVNQFGSHMERLECGHEQVRKADIVGPTNAVRRRCRKCLE